ncbi:hypothetical protein NE237_004821 [Protea cynaroides]|uniref:Uncharacterized protein n=1 Tax=Protea cynaroides TaxID=273540 RepID=A0A9Q0KJH0_9MAGN|nr:hypothetical protein NE237_004821 [Protea cynaroides]
MSDRVRATILVATTAGNVTKSMGLQSGSEDRVAGVESEVYLQRDPLMRYRPRLKPGCKSTAKSDCRCLFGGRGRRRRGSIMRIPNRNLFSHCLCSLNHLRGIN